MDIQMESQKEIWKQGKYYGLQSKEKMSCLDTRYYFFLHLNYLIFFTKWHVG